MIEVLEPKWISTFERSLRLSGVREGDLIGVLAVGRAVGRRFQTQSCELRRGLDAPHRA